ncbi:hypothetical protein [Poseidonibacter ostreae]|uniref:Uncharacterized protein n=1 Tax=Poseidonibacter ostreae TaxID=2654171 RepID=A0A6L4WV08_9BACT|nr:hypothetical protein [Poseidonibacter ostreae]KAB7890285.1 hypothetical protein GBG19_03375 [Poseidonibacter ostreae]
MEKNKKIILRKRIKEYNIINNLNNHTPVELPRPPIYNKHDYLILSWFFKLRHDEAYIKYVDLLNYLSLPIKENIDFVEIKIHRLCWWDIIFEVYEVKNICQ